MTKKRKIILYIVLIITIILIGKLAYTVDAVGNLNLDLGQNQSMETAKLEQAVAEIAKRPSLKLVAENEEMINGQKALVMKEIGVLKTDPEYIYAVRETLTMEFDFKAEIEK